MDVLHWDICIYRQSRTFTWVGSYQIAILIYQKSFPILPILLFSGADVNYTMAPDADAYDCCCGSMLMMAINQGCDEIIPILIEHPEIDLHLRYENTSALDIAATTGNSEALDTLLSVRKACFV